MSNRVVRSLSELRQKPHPIDPLFFVLRRQNASWSSAATIVSVWDNEKDAEEAASSLKRHGLTHQHFGVAALRSEARDAVAPIEIVRVPAGAVKEVA